MASSLATFASLLKTYFNPQKVENLTECGKPLYSMIKKNTAISGNPWQVPIIYANPQGVSTTLANAQTQSAGAGGNVASVAWSITVGDYSGSVGIGDKAIMASRNNVGAFLENKVTEIEGLYESASNAISIYLWRNGGGSTGVIASGGTTTAMTLTNPQDAFNFEVGEILQASANDGSSTAHVLLAGSATITAIDRVAGIITIGVAQAAWANTSNLFRLGDFQGNVSTSLIKGVDAFVTSSTSPGVLWGVTRTTDVQRLSGSKIAAADVFGKGIEERLQLLGAYMQGRYRAMTSGGDYRLFLHPEDWQNLALSVQSRGTRSLDGGTAEINFEYIEVICAGRKIKTFSDPYASKGTGYLLRMENWVLGSLGELLRIPSGDGLQMLRGASTNDYEYRIQSYPAVSCNAPGYQGRVSLP